MNKVRKSNIELLRIIAMFLILFYHAIARGVIQYRMDTPILGSLYVVSYIGVILFLLISGYFGIKPSVKGFLKLYFLLVFYKVLLFVVYLIRGWGEISIGVKEVVTLFLPFSGAVGHWWFFRTYILLYLTSPILNYVKKGGGGRDLAIILLGIITFWFSWIWNNPNFEHGKNVVNFAFLYLLGDWLKDTFVITDTNRKRMRSHYICLYLLMALAIGITLFYASPRFYNIMIRMCYRYDSPVLMLMSVLFFLVFTTFDFSSKGVNWVASSAVAVYAIHENKYFDKQLWYGFIEQQYLSNDIGFFLLLLLGYCACMYVACIFIDKIRLLVMIPINPVIEKVSLLSEKISFKVDRVYHTLINNKN